MAKAVAKDDKSKKPKEKKDGDKKSKGARKKWSKGRIAEKAQNKSFFDKNALGGLTKSIAKAQCITVNKVVNDLKIRGSMARVGIRYLAAQGLITPVSTHSKCLIYTTAAPATTATTAQVKVTVNK